MSAELEAKRAEYSKQTIPQLQALCDAKGVKPNVKKPKKADWIDTLMATQSAATATTAAAPTAPTAAAPVAAAATTVPVAVPPPVSALLAAAVPPPVAALLSSASAPAPAVASPAVRPAVASVPPTPLSPQLSAAEDKLNRKLEEKVKRAEEKAKAAEEKRIAAAAAAGTEIKQTRARKSAAAPAAVAPAPVSAPAAVTPQATTNSLPVATAAPAAAAAAAPLSKKASKAAAAAAAATVTATAAAAAAALADTKQSDADVDGGGDDDDDDDDDGEGEDEDDEDGEDDIEAGIAEQAKHLSEEEKTALLKQLIASGQLEIEDDDDDDEDEQTAQQKASAIAAVFESVTNMRAQPMRVPTTLDGDDAAGGDDDGEGEGDDGEGEDGEEEDEDEDDGEDGDETSGTAADGTGDDISFAAPTFGGTASASSSSSSSSAAAAAAAAGVEIDATAVLAAGKKQHKSAVVDRDGTTAGAEYDLHHLIAYDPTPIDSHALHTDKTYLLSHSRENVQLLFNRIFALPESKELTHAVLLQRGESGRVVDLPDASTKFPRHKPVPKVKALTKWEAYAKERGLHKKKRSRMVYDEYSESYKPRTGYGRVVKDGSDQWVIEAKPSDDGSVDPWTKMRQDKKSRIEKNSKQKSKNLEAADGPRLPGTIDLSSAVKAAGGVRPGKRNQQGKMKQKHHVDVALGVAGKSTASMGRFDGTSKRFASLDAGVRVPKGAPRRDHISVGSEKKQSMAVLQKVLGRESADSNKFSAEKAANVHIRRSEKAASLTAPRAGGKKANAGGGGDGDGDNKSRGQKRKGAQASAAARKGPMKTGGMKGGGGKSFKKHKK